jgi:hypothetical protein
MGFLDKAKGFMGGHGVKVELTRIERQDPSSARFPVTDSVFKCNCLVTAEKDAVVLKHVARLMVNVIWTDGSENIRTLSEEVHDSSTDIIGADIKWPYELKAGQSKEDGFVLSDIDLPAMLAKLDVPDPNMAVGNPNVKVVAEVTADVKGSPFDPKGEAQVILTAGGADAVATPPKPAGKPAANRVLAFFEDGYYEATLLESNESGHHLSWDDGTDSWVVPSHLLTNGMTAPHPSQISVGQRVLARYEHGFYESTAASIDPGDMVNPAKVLIQWDDGTESWVGVHDVRLG